MKYILTILLVLLFQIAYGKPSFDCDNAATRTEQVICSDERLAGLDIMLDHTYKKVINAVGIKEKQRLKNDQIKWLKKRNADTCDIKCISKLYYERYYELAEYHDEHIVKYDPCESMLGGTPASSACMSIKLEKSNKKLENAFKEYLQRNMDYMQGYLKSMINQDKQARIDEFNAWKKWRDAYCYQAVAKAQRGKR